MKLTTALIATTTALVLPGTAFANSTAESISICKTEIRSQLPETVQDVDIDFKKVRGTSRLKTMSFRLEADGQRDAVKCKVRRDDSVEIVWGDDIKPSQLKLVEKEDAKTVSGGE